MSSVRIELNFLPELSVLQIALVEELFRAHQTAARNNDNVSKAVFGLA